MAADPRGASHRATANVRRFIAFRVFFNARFYYPVFTVLFIDYGLTVAQFSMLNALWAAVIVLAEVPSGAMADLVGRRRLLILAALLMVVEMAVLALVPIGAGTLLVAAMAVNRVLSGLAEAAASGADEALVYDSLKAAGLAHRWPKVLERQMRWQAAAFLVAMVLGAAVYDPRWTSAAVAWLGGSQALGRQLALRAPVWLTLAMAVACLVVVLGFDEPEAGPRQGKRPSMRAAFGQTLAAGRWIAATPFAVAVMAAGMIGDAAARMVITLSSQYYRLIHLPEASFGLLGAAVAVAGFVVPRMAAGLVERLSFWKNILLLFAVQLACLAAMDRFWPYVGLVPALGLFSSMYLTGFFTSHYLNQVTASDRRATVLSFKGLVFNLAYGLVGVLYGAMAGGAGGTGPVDQDVVFTTTFWVFPAGYLVAACLFGLAAKAGGRRR